MSSLAAGARRRSGSVHVERVQSARGHEVAWCSSGSAPGAVLVLGGWLTHVELDLVHGPLGRFHRALSGRRRLLRLDLPGTGLSPRPDEPLDLDSAVAAAVAVVEASGERSTTVLSVGLADAVAVRLAQTRADLVDGLVLMGAGPGPAQRDADLLSTLRAARALAGVSWRLGVAAVTGALAPGATPRQAAWFAEHQQRCAHQRDGLELLDALLRMDAGPVLTGLAHPATDLRRTLGTPDTVPYFVPAAAVLDELDELGRAPGPRLTRREHAVLGHVSQGSSNRRIAHALGISEHTAAKHVANLFRKLGVNNRCSAVLAAHQLGLLSTTFEQLPA